MKRAPLIAAAVLLAGTVFAFAQGGSRSDGRYIVTEVEDGILRVDRQSGHVSHCRERRSEWTCELVADDRDALESELARLRDENRRLRRRLAGYDPEAARRYGAYGRQPDHSEDDSGLMSKQEVDQAMDTLEYMMDRFMGAADKYRRDLPPPR